MAKSRKTGRPSKFDTLDTEQVRKLCERGFTDKEIADFFNVTVRTFHNWKKEHPDFFHSLKEWKEIADEKVERSLYERATGYEHPDVHISNFQGAITVTDITKHYPPDTTAAIFWLKNRKPADWRDKQPENDDTDDFLPNTVRIESD